MPGLETFALKGNLLYTREPSRLECFPDHYLVCENGCVAGIFPCLPDRYAHVAVEDCGSRLIVPGLTDLHLHAPQYAFRGLGMDLELLDWLDSHTFPEESRYADPVYAERAYRLFVRDLQMSTTTRACIFATIHADATLLLMQLLEETGLVAMVGKVNMDMNSPESYCETTDGSLAETERWIRESLCRYKNVSPILTPRFAPVCSGRLMASLGRLQQKYALPLQSHLSESLGEVAWVKSLFPDCGCYGDVYDRFGLFGSNGPVVMAHCVYSGREERELIRKKGVFIAHCPQSNVNLSSGIAPAKSCLQDGLKVGLGSDIAGGFSLSGFRGISDAIQMSKMHWRLQDPDIKPLSFSEAFYLATKGGGAFFGKVGSFETDYEFDALVLDDAAWPSPSELEPESRLERLVYLGDDRCIRKKYVKGRKIVG
ncbi:amidohydrolase family protein [Oxalobacter aliiformigenes]|uniref:amidohydrolase family protein n=1 Tax=Oxalobacter aliiformigenes TaxID=2946593 RepID=UPI0022AEA950|nr:amidohydrolase family protein [Oxalobacter aliiformigenes]MCZ4064481.1 amidohydrolase family protein [Oxalobacter aliiformigenes]WAV99821.1 amidohydrolase family protein [Oxalobacter aliiformigenes]